MKNTIHLFHTKYAKRRFMRGFALIFCFLLYGSSLIAQNNLDSIPDTSEESIWIVGLVYKPYSYRVSPFDPDIDEGYGFHMPMMYVNEDLDLTWKNCLNNYSIGGSLAFRFKPHQFIKTGLEFSQIIYYYGSLSSLLQLIKQEETFSTFVYDYVNTLEFKHIQVPLLWSLQAKGNSPGIGLSIDLGFLFSRTIAYRSHSKLYWKERDPQGPVLVETDIPAYEIILDSETSTFKNIRYDQKGELKYKNYNRGERAARRFIIGGLAEISLYYNITSSIRVGVGAWFNIDFIPIEKRGRAGDLTPLLGYNNIESDNIDYFYNIREGISFSFDYLFQYSPVKR